MKALLGILEPGTTDAKASDLARASAATALGRILAGGTPRALPRLSRDYPYRGSIPLLEAILTME